MHIRIVLLALAWSVSAAAYAHNVNPARTSFGTAGSEYAVQLTCAAPRAVAASSGTLCRLAAAPALALTASVSWELPASLILAAPYIAAGAGVTAGIVYGLISLLRWLRLNRNDSYVSLPPSSPSQCSTACSRAPAPHDPNNNKKNKKNDKKARKQEKKRKKEAQKRCTCGKARGNNTRGDPGGCYIERMGKRVYVKYIPNPKHGKVARKVGDIIISAEPKNALEALKNSVEYSDKLRFGISSGELVALRMTSATPELVFHGYVIDLELQLTPALRSFLLSGPLAQALKSIL